MRLDSFGITTEFIKAIVKSDKLKLYKGSTVPVFMLHHAWSVVSCVGGGGQWPLQCTGLWDAHKGCVFLVVSSGESPCVRSLTTKGIGNGPSADWGLHVTRWSTVRIARNNLHFQLLRLHIINSITSVGKMQRWRRTLSQSLQKALFFWTGLPVKPKPVFMNTKLTWYSGRNERRDHSWNDCFWHTYSRDVWCWMSVWVFVACLNDFPWGRSIIEAFWPGGEALEQLEIFFFYIKQIFFPPAPTCLQNLSKIDAP